MTMPLTSVLISTIKMLHMMLSCGIQLLALFMNVFHYTCDSAAQAKVDGEQLVGAEGESIRSYANINDTKNFYEALKGVYGPRRFSLHPVRSTDVALIKNKELILKRWAEYLQNLLITVHSTYPGFLDDLPTLPIIPKHDDPPSFDEVEKAILSLKGNKTDGHDNIPAEVIKYGSCALHRRLHNFILNCWSAKCLPQKWKNAYIILAYKQKGDRAECGNSRGISLLSVAGIVLAKNHAHPSSRARG